MDIVITVANKLSSSVKYTHTNSSFRKFSLRNLVFVVVSLRLENKNQLKLRCCCYCCFSIY